MKRTSSFLLTVLIVSCNSTNGDKNIIVDKDTTNKLHSYTFKTIKSLRPETFLFKYSKCINNCKDNEKIFSTKWNGDSLTLKFGTIENCTGNFRPEVKLYNDTLDINIKIKETVIKGKNSKFDTIIEEAECDCYFYFDIGIINLTQQPKTILLNGHRIGSKTVAEDNIVYPKQNK